MNDTGESGNRPAVTLGTEPGAVLRHAEALAALELYASAATLAARVVPADARDEAALQLAWWLLRDGQAAAALRRLAVLPDDAHPLVPVVRDTARAVAEPDTAADALRELLTGISRRQPSPVELCCVVFRAQAAGDEDTAVDAARRYLELTDGPDAQMSAVLAPREAREGRPRAAAAAAVDAAAARPDDPDGTIRAIAEKIGATDRLAGLLFLAEGYRAYRRAIFGDLLDERIPLLLRYRNRLVGSPICGILLAVALLSIDSAALSIPALACFALAALSLITGLIVRAPGANSTQTSQITYAHSAYRIAHGKSDISLLALGVGAAAFNATSVFTKGEADAWTPGMLAVTLGVTALCVATIVVLGLRQRRRNLDRGQAPEVDQIDPARCRCWETDRLSGAAWRRYLAEHLELIGTDDALHARILHCPHTTKRWLHLPAHDAAIAIGTPDAADREEQPALDGYL